MYRAAIVGCGRIGSEFDDDPKRKIISSHAGAYTNVRGVELVAVSDINEEKRTKCQKKWGVKSAYADYKEMLEKENIDILSICTWNSTHFEILKEAVKHGIRGIFCEKPISNTLKDADEMIRVAREKNVVLMINHQRRFDPFHQKVKEFVESPLFGKLQQATFYYTAGIANSGTHMFDLLRFYFGNVEWVQAAYNDETKISPEPNINGILKFKNVGFCGVQSCEVEHYYIFELDALGTNSRFRIKHAGFDFDFYSIKESHIFSGYKDVYPAFPPIDKDIPRNFMIDAVKHMVDCLNTNRKPISSGEDGRAALELICAFHESAQNEGRRVYLPLKDSNIVINSK